MKKLTAILGLCCAAAVHADVTYTYTGSNFSSFAYASSPTDVYPWTLFTPTDSLTLEFTFSAALPASSSIQFLRDLVPTINHQSGPSPVTPISWRASAGPLELTNPSMLNAYLVTDNQGNIVQWNVGARDSIPGEGYRDGTLFSGTDRVINSSNLFHPSYVNEFAATCLGNATCLQATGYPIGSTTVPGTWKMTAVPEPDAVLLTLFGALCIAPVIRSSRSKKAA